MGKYVDSKVWLRVPGGVEGWNVIDLNYYIDRWNSPRMEPFHSVCDFFEWLSYEEGRTIYGFSVLWKSKLDSKVHIIRRR